MVRRIEWSRTAKEELRSICAYIRQDSPQNASKVREKILSLTRGLAKGPERCNPDKYKINKDDRDIRVCLVYRYRVVYEVKDAEVLVLHINHSSMEPREY